MVVPICLFSSLAFRNMLAGYKVQVPVHHSVLFCTADVWGEKSIGSCKIRLENACKSTKFLQFLMVILYTTQIFYCRPYLWKTQKLQIESYAVYFDLAVRIFSVQQHLWSLGHDRCTFICNGVINNTVYIYFFPSVFGKWIRAAFMRGTQSHPSVYIGNIHCTYLDRLK